jgi:exodeoxyribonuclease VII large subunit
VDFSISDFCADYRAPTPSAAAEVVARDSVELLAELDGFDATLTRLLKGRIDILKTRLDRIESHYAFKMPAQRLATMSQRLDEIQSRLEESILRLIRERKQQLDNYVKQIDLVKPDRVLQRGYSITRNQSGEIVKSIEDLDIGDEIETRFAQGYSQSRVIKLGADNGEKESR